MSDSGFRKAEDGNEWEDMDDDEEESSGNENDDSADSLLDEDMSVPGKPLGEPENFFWEEETKSRFTEYSMTSSVMRRNDQLTLHDERFEKVQAP